MSGLLADRTSLVVGGEGGIGRAIVDLFRAQGAKVISADLVREPVSEGVIGIDVTDEDSVVAAVAEAERRLGHIDILVNSAGVSGEIYWDELDLAAWNRFITINLTGTFLVCRSVVPGMVRRGRGRIINIASQLAIKGADGLAAYSASKAGVVGYTKSLALELAPHGVLVNALAPGPINTTINDALSDEWKQAKTSQLPLGRFGQPGEVAPTALLLASDPGGNLYVGQTLGPNSGDVMP